MSVAENIKNLRKERGYTQKDLASILGVAPTTVSAWESGRAKPLMDKVTLIADTFNVPLSKVAGPSTIKIVPSKSAPVHKYPYYPAQIAAGALTTVDPVTSEDIEQIELSDAVMGKYAGSKDIIIMRINGESMNRVIPNHSLIGVKRLENTSELDDGDIVVFCIDDEDYSVKRFYDDKRAGILSFTPDSDSDAFHPINFRREDADGLQVIGRVITYVVNL